MKDVLAFLLEALKIIAGLIGTLLKEDALIVEINGKNRKIVVPMIIALGVIQAFTTILTIVLMS